MENPLRNKHIPLDQEKLVSTPTLVHHFLDIREKPTIKPDLEDFEPVFSKDSYRKHIYEEVKKSFDFIFKKEEVIHHLNLEPNDDSRVYLRRVRRYGLVLRAVYQFLDINHQCPEDFHIFLSSLGKLNDKYLVSPAIKNKRVILSSIDKISLPINFSETENFTQHALFVLSEIESLLGKKVLDFDRLHTLRKDIRLFADLMQVAASEDYEGKMHWLF